MVPEDDVQETLPRLVRASVLLTVWAVLGFSVTAWAVDPPGIEVNIVAWPDGPDLCRAPWMEELCAADRRIREELATAAVAPSAGGDTVPRELYESCRGFFAERAEACAPNPCTDPRLWRDATTIYRTGFLGAMLFAGEKRLISRVGDGGDVEWVWRGTEPAERAAFTLPDGTRVRLSLPGTAPPTEPELLVVAPDPPAAPAISLPAAPAEAEPPRDEAPSPEPAPAETARIEPPRDEAPPPEVTSPPKKSATEPIGRPAGEPLLLLALPLASLVGLLVLFSRGQRAAPERRPPGRVRRRAGRAAPSVEPLEGDLLDFALHPEPPSTAWSLVTADLAGPVEPRALLPASTLSAAEKVEAPDPWCRLRDEIDETGRDEIACGIDAACQLGEWTRCLFPVLEAVQLDPLKPPARREWREAAGVVRRFVDRELPELERLRDLLAGVQVPAVDVPVPAGLGDLAAAPQERWRRHLLSPDEGRVSCLVLALQYLVEAFPVEHLEAPARVTYRRAIREGLETASLPLRYHDLVGELASRLGLRYEPVRYYRTRLGESGCRQLDETYATMPLAERLGFEAGTEEGAVVRLAELFLEETASGGFYSGRAWIAESPGS